MKSAFDANVPRRKPRTRLGTMLAEIDAVSEQTADETTKAKAEVSVETEVAAETEVAKETKADRVKAKVRRAAKKKKAKAAPKAKAKVAPKVEAKAVERVAETPAAEAPAVAVAQAPVMETAQARVDATPVAETPAAPVIETAIATEVIAQAEAIAHPVVQAPEAPTQARSTDTVAPEPMQEPAPAALGDALASMTTEPAAMPLATAAPISQRPLDPVLRQTESTVQDSREMIAQLRERLRRSRRQQLPIAPPEATATRVKETVGVLQAELTKTQEEREELVREAENLRRSLTTAEARNTHLEDELTTAQDVARQRDTLAEAAIEESEVMAVERDEALSRLSELHAVHTEREAVLAELEGDLNEARRSTHEMQAQLQSLRDTLHNAMTDIEVSRSELTREREERRRQEDRVRELEDDMARMQNARSALVEIQRLVDTVP